MKGSTVVIVGAGFSKRAGGPLMNELFDETYCRDIRASSPGFLRGVREDMSRRGAGKTLYTFEDYFSDVWRIARTGGSITFDNGETFSAELWLRSITTHLASVTAAIHARRNTRAYRSYLKFLECLPTRSTTFISFNYDLLLEQLLTDMRISYSYGLPRTAEGASEGPKLMNGGRQMRLLKLHGSVNWLVCRGCSSSGRRSERVSVLDRAYVPLTRRSCPACGTRQGDVGLVPPIFGKAGEAVFLSDVWRKARAELREAARVIIIGYSLPPSDLEARSLLEELRQRQQHPPVLLVSGKKAAENYVSIVANFTDSKMLAEDFFEHLHYASFNGSASYHACYENAIPSFGRFYSPRASSDG